jgi:hypothetical protein
MSTNAELYEQDFYAWTRTTAELIRAGKWADLDREALAEEIESSSPASLPMATLMRVWTPATKPASPSSPSRKPVRGHQSRC